MRKSIVVILVIILVVVLCSCRKTASDNIGQPDVAIRKTAGMSEAVKGESSTIGTDEQFDLESYKKMASEFRVSTYAASVVLSNMGNYENTYWKTLGTLSDSMVDAAFSWLAKNSDESQETVTANYEDIRAVYKELILIDFGDNAEASEIDAGVRALYDGYSELYNAVTRPSGSRAHFASHVSNLISEIQSANDDLLLFLPENTQ